MPAFAPSRLGFAMPMLGVLLTLGAYTALPAEANEELKAPAYTISIVEGQTTAPEWPVLSTSGSVHIPHTKEVTVALRITEPNGVTTVAEGESESGDVWLGRVVPQIGDYVDLESPRGHVLETVKYDGLPSLDPTVCAGSTNFSGQRTEGEEVEGSAYTVAVHPSYTREHPDGTAQIASLSGTAFGGNFLKPLALGETVRAQEHLTTVLGGGETFTYTSENIRPVGSCPAPPPPPPPPPPPALHGSIFKLLAATIHKLLKSGLTDQVTINQAGTVTQDLYELNGTVPASAASAHRRAGHRHKHKPPALLLARGTASATTAGTVTVHLRLTAKGRHALNRKRKMRAVLVTTLAAGAGAKSNLPTRTVTLDR
jgi:hypothetical protein